MLPIKSYNMDVAKEMRKKALRPERNFRLTEQDIAFQRALESGEDTAPIVAEKQRLRDLPQQCDTCTTLAELKAITVSPE